MDEDLYDDLAIGRAEYQTRKSIEDQEDSITPAKSKKIDLFRGYIRAIIETDEIFDDYRNYVPHVVNRHLSYEREFVFLANYLNCNARMSAELQFHFLRTSIPKKRRYITWIKKTIHERIALIKAVYKYSDEKALAVVDLLTEENYNALEQSLNMGGKIK